MVDGFGCVRPPSEALPVAGRPYQELQLVGVLLGLLVLDAPLLYLLRQDVHREAGVDPARVLQQGLVHELVLGLGARAWKVRNK